MNKRTLLCFALAYPACALDQPAGDPIAESDFLPDGATGIQRIQLGSQVMTVPWVARDGMKWVDDDYSIGPAPVNEVYAETTLTPGSKWPLGHVPYCIHDKAADGTIQIGPNDSAQIDASLDTLEKIAPLHFDKFTCGSSSQPQTFLDYRKKLDDKNTSVTTSGIGHDGNTIQFNKNSADGDLDDHTITHETGHALGYMHEQKRPDFKQFVIFTPPIRPTPRSSIRSMRAISRRSSRRTTSSR
jgi:hypothetical protein